MPEEITNSQNISPSLPPEQGLPPAPPQKKKISPVFFVFFAFFFFILILGIAIKILSQTNPHPSSPATPTPHLTVSPTTPPETEDQTLSPSNDLNVIEEEINQTDLGSFDQDFEDLASQAAEL